MNKKYTLTILMLAMALNTVFAQTSTKRLSYQAVVRNAANELVVNQNLAVEITVLDAGNAPQYRETHASVPTNQNGLLWLWVGEGNPTLGTMEDVVWKDATIRSVFTLPDGSTVTQNTPVTAMPHAFFADEVDTVFLQNYLDTHDVVPDNYVTHPQLNDTLDHYYTKGNVDNILNDYEKKSELCGDVKDCIKDTLGHYTTTNQIDTLLGAYFDSTQVKTAIHDTADAIRAAIPASQVNADWNATGGPAEILNKPDLSVYATTNALKDSLTRYVDKDKLTDTLDSYYTKNNIDNKLNDYEKKSDLCGDVKDCIKDTLAAYYDTADVKQMLKPYLKANELCDSIVKCEVVKNMRDSLHNAFDTLKYYTTSNEIDTLLGAYFDSTKVKSVISDTATALRAMMGDAANDGIITIDVSGGTIENPTFSVNQANNQTVKITIPETIPAEDGQLTIIAAGDTTRFTANQATNDTVRLNKFATKDTLAAYYDTTHTKDVISDTATALRAMMVDAANDGQLTIIAAGDTTRFTANQATNDTMRLNKFATKDTLAAYYDTADVKQMLKPYLKANELCDSIVKCDVIKDIRDSLGNAFDTLKYYYTSKKINDTLKHYYDTTYVNQTLKQYLKSGDLCDSIENNCTNVALKNKDNLFTYRNQFDSTVFFKNETQFDSIAYFNERTYFDKDVNIDGDVIFKGYNYYNNVNNFYEHDAIVLIDEAVNPNTLGPVQSTQDQNLNRKLAVNYNDLMVVYDTLKKTAQNGNAALAARIVADSNRLVEFKGKVHNDSLALAERIDTIYRHLCDSVMNCTDIKTMQTDIAANKTNIGLNKQAIIDSSAHIRNEIKNGQITIAVNRSTTTTETTVTNPTFGVNQEADQTVTINIPQETTVNNGQLTIVAAGDTTRFTANQAANDTVRLDKFATKEALKDTAKTLRGIICDSATACITKALADPTSEINHAIDTIARHHVSDSTRMVFDTLHKYYATKDTLKNFVNKLAIRDSVNKVVTDSLRKGPSEMTRAIDSIARHHVSDSTRMVFDTLHKYYATKDTLKNFVNKLAIRDSVNNIVKDSLAAPNSAINIAIDTIARHNISDSTRMVFDTLHNYYATKDTLKNFVNKLAIRDSVNKVVKDSLRIGTSAINIAIDTIARHNIHDTAVAIRNSIGNGTLTIQKNGSTVGTFTANQSIDQPVNVNITVPTAVTDLSDAADYAKINGNTFTGTHNFNNASITVPSNTDAIKRPSTTTTPCTDMNAVNVCDLLAVFDSLTKRIDALQEELDAFKNAAPPVFNSLNLSEVTATSMKVTSSFTSQGFNITSYNFCYSTNSDMSGSVCVPSTNPVITLEGLDPYTTYYVTASATNVVGTTQSNIVNARTPASKPTATVTATTSTPKGITVSLSNLDFKQPGEGTVQIFYKKKTNETCGTNIADYNSLPESETISNGSPYSQTIPNLEQETAYCVIVKLQNADSAVYTSPIEATSGATNKLVISSEYFDLIESNRVWLCEHSGPTPTTVTFSAALLLGDSIDKYDNFTWSYSQTDNTHPLPGIAPSPISNGNTYTITFTSTSSYPDLINIECTAQHKITGEWISGVLENLRVDNNIQQDNPVHNLVENYFIVTVNNPPGHYDISYSKVIWGDGSEIERNVGYGMYHDYESAGAGTYNVTLINLYDYLGITSGCMTTTTVTVVEPPASIYKCTVTTPHQSPEYQSDGLTHRDGYEEVSNGKITSVTDYEGNVYPVVQIGSQCWIAENLRCQYSPNTGSNIVDNSLSGSQTQNKKYFRTSKGKSAHWFDNNSETYASYGLLYNYCAAMDFYYDNEFSTYIGYWDASSKISSPHRGICPKGWHIPTNDEWTTLKNNENANQPVKLAGDGWPDSQPGYCIQTCPCGTANRNLSGFTALPAARVTGTFSSFPKESTETTYFWSSTCNNSSYASSASMSKDSAQFGIQQTNTDFQYLYSVRCIRDAEPQP